MKAAEVNLFFVLDTACLEINLNMTNKEQLIKNK